MFKVQLKLMMMKRSFPIYTKLMGLNVMTLTVRLVDFTKWKWELRILIYVQLYSIIVYHMFETLLQLCKKIHRQVVKSFVLINSNLKINIMFFVIHIIYFNWKI